MGRVALTGLASALIVLALGAGGGLAQDTVGGAAEEKPQVGFLAPDFALFALSSASPVKLSDFRGKTVLLDFWASWCPPCRREMPALQKLYGAFKDRGLEIVAVSIDTTRSDVAEFATTQGLTFPILLDLDHVAARMYRVAGIPTHYLIDRGGVIRVRAVGGQDWSRPEAWRQIEELIRIPDER
jgi:peroxiredoxin